MHYKLRKFILLAFLLEVSFFLSFLESQAQCVGAFQVLHYTETGAADYNTKAASLAMFQSIGATYNFTVVEDSTGDEFNSLANLQNYSVVIFSNTSGNNILTPAQRANFEAYINAGGSYLGIHSAAETYRHSSADGTGTGVWDWFAENVNGASAQASPKATTLSTSHVLTQNPLAQPYFIGVPNPYVKTDAYYYWENGYVNPTFLEVLTVDTTGTESYDEARMVALVAELTSGGRAFYTSLGRSATDFSSDTAFQHFIRNAVLWTSAPNIDIVVGTGLVVTGVATDATCLADDGSIDITVTGGSGTYTFDWSNGASSEDIAGLAPNLYGVLANDGAGCYGLLTFEIENGPFPVADITVDQEISCPGDTDAALTANVTGTAGPYTYDWDFGPTTPSVTGLGAGTYSVEVTNTAGCKDTATTVLTDPLPLTLSINETQSILCFGDATGALEGVVGGGTMPYTYSWSSGPTTAQITGLTAGKYILTVTDANSCTITDSLTITEPLSLLTTVTISQEISCFGSTDGEVTSTASGGTPPYTYSWSGGATTANVAGLGAGKQVLTLTDANGCIAQDSVTLIEPPLGVLTLTVTDSIDCFGDSSGQITALMTGGTSPYTYSWDNGQTTAVASNLPAGKHVLTVTDANACVSKDSLILVEPTDLVIAFSVTNAISCFGDADGEITSTVTGGTAPYTYAWSGGAATAVASGLSGGKHILTITDAKGCTQKDSLVLAEPSAIVLTVSVTNNVSCFGGSNGEATGSATGGTAPYTYAWSSGSTTATASGLSAGKHVLTLTDANGCIAKDSVIITEPSLGVLTLTETISIDCFGAATGQITGDITGGTPPYTFAWDNGQNTAVANNLAAGKHILTVTDANGCVSQDSLVLTEPTELLLTASITNNISCFGAMDGEATGLASGGTTPYTYSWDNGQTTAIATNLDVGKHVLTVIDANGCTQKDSVDFTQPDSLVAIVTVVSQISCFGANDGVIIAGETGGSAPYTYAWNSGQTTSGINALGPGTYIVTITDANGCTAVDSVSIVEPADLQLILTESQSIDCYGNSTGEIMATPSGGTMPYTYAWDNGQTTAIASNLPAGQHLLTLTDANGCSVQDSLTLTQPDSLTVTASVNTIISCFGTNDGIVEATVGGGTLPYTYAWSNGATTAQAGGLGAGTYTITITDANGCMAIDSITLTEPTALQLSLTETQSISCFGASDGVITSSLSGGTFPYTYSWNNGQNTAVAFNLDAGTHILTATDANGCVIVDSLVLSQPDSLQVSASVTGLISCFGGNDGAIGSSVSGGTAPYTYSWSNGQTTASINGLVTGTYTITITDANGCMAVDSVTILQPTAMQLSLSEAISISCNGASDGAISAFASGGTPFYSYAWDNRQTGQTAINLSAGWHIVEVTDQRGCTVIDSLFLTEPDSLIGSITEISSIACYGNTTGVLQVSATGGTMPYDYAWNTGSPNTLINNLGAGQYSVIITDVRGCVDTVSYDLTEPDSISVLTNITQTISCNGANDGEVSSTVMGGTAPYTYLWSTGDTTASISNLIAGSYSVIVTDANGCTGIGLIDVTEPASLALGFSNLKNVSCNGGNDGEVTVVVTGGTMPYTYVWSNGQTGDQATGLAAGTYQVIVTDARSCQDSATVTITEPTAITALLNISQVISCNGANDGSITATPMGGTAPYSYLWSDAQTTQTAVNLAAGNYAVIVTDSLGCAYLDSLVISEPSQLVADIAISQPISCEGDSDGSLSVLVQGGTGPYTFAWNTGATDSTIVGLPSGTYSYTVTDAMGCTAVADTLFEAPQVLQTEIVILDSIDCFQAKTASLLVKVQGGTPTYVYNWVDGSTTAARSGLGEGTYRLTVVDARGCAKMDSITIVSPPELTITTQAVSDASCSGAVDGEISVTPSGGTAPYSYIWSTGDTTATVQGVGAGTYQITVLDSKNCVVIDSVQVTEPQPLTLSLAIVSPITCFEGSDGEILADVHGGTAPYTYLWNDGQTDSLATGLKRDIYNIEVRDSQGCTLNQSILLGEPDLLSIQFDQIQTANCGSADNGSALATGMGGVGPYSYLWENGQTTSTIQDVLPGEYVLTLTDSLGCVTRDSVVIGERVPWRAEISILDSVVCSNSEDGRAGVSIFGPGPGTGYTYLWSNGQFQNIAVNLGPESYSVVVADEFGCDTTLAIQMNQPVGIEVFASIILATPGESNGSIKVDSISNGAAPYSFFWSSGDTDSLASQLSQGNYFLNLVDDNGCEVRQEFQVDTTTFAWENFEAIPDFNLYQIQLRWSTLREIGNSVFTIERSVDGLAFTPILEQASGGNSLSPQSYEDWDTNPIEGRSFYRLKQTSENGFFTFYSPVREIFFGNEEPGYVLVFPVPVIRGDYLRVEFEMKSSKNTDILMRNAAHQEVYNMSVPLPEGRQSYQIPTEGLSPGHYYIMVTNGEEAYAAQFIIQDP